MDGDHTDHKVQWEERLRDIFCGGTEDKLISSATDSPQEEGCKFEISCTTVTPYPWESLLATTGSIVGMGLGVFIIRFAWYWCTDRELGWRVCAGRNAPTGSEDEIKDYKALRGMGSAQVDTEEGPTTSLLERT